MCLSIFRVQEHTPANTATLTPAIDSGFLCSQDPYGVHLPVRHQLETWDLDILLKYIKTGFPNNDQLALDQL